MYCLGLSNGGPTCPISNQSVLQWITDMANAGANIFTFHIEATDDAARCIKMITAAGMKVSESASLEYLKADHPLIDKLPF